MDREVPEEDAVVPGQVRVLADPRRLAREDGALQIFAIGRDLARLPHLACHGIGASAIHVRLPSVLRPVVVGGRTLPGVRGGRGAAVRILDCHPAASEAGGHVVPIRRVGRIQGARADLVLPAVALWEVPVTDVLVSAFVQVGPAFAAGTHLILAQERNARLTDVVRPALHPWIAGAVQGSAAPVVLNPAGSGLTFLRGAGGPSGTGTGTGGATGPPSGSPASRPADGRGRGRGRSSRGLRGSGGAGAGRASSTPSSSTPSAFPGAGLPAKDVAEIDVAPDGKQRQEPRKSQNSACGLHFS